MEQETKKISNGVKIIHELEKCIGCGSCVAICPEHFEMTEDGKAHILKSKLNPDSGNQELEIDKLSCFPEAVEICPVQCIHIKK